MSSVDIVSLVISLLSIVISVTMTILIYRWSKKDTSTDYKLKDDIIKDLMLLEGHLNSICVKSATSHLQRNLDLVEEIKFIKSFLVSPTMCFIMSYDHTEEDKLFYLDLFLIANNGNDIASSASLAKNATEMLHNICNMNLIDKLKKISSAECLKLITNNKEQINWLLQVTNKNVEQSKTVRNQLVIQKMQHIKSKGISDPYIDLFILLESGKSPDEEELDTLLDLCKKQYGRIDVTDKEIFEKYKDYLIDFKFDENA